MQAVHATIVSTGSTETPLPWCEILLARVSAGIIGGQGSDEAAYNMGVAGHTSPYETQRIASVGVPGLASALAQTSTIGGDMSRQRPATNVGSEVQRLVAEGRVQAARVLLAQTVTDGHVSEALSRWRRVLAPAEARLRKGEPQRSPQREQRWLRQHAREYRGQWVALDGELLVAAGDDLNAVVESIRARGSASDVLLYRVDPEDSA